MQAVVFAELQSEVERTWQEVTGFFTNLWLLD